MPVGKPEIVFDLGARSRLPAGRVGFHSEHVKSFRRAVDRGGQPGRSGADDHDVSHVGLIDSVIEAEALGDLLVARVLEHVLAVADQHRDLRHADVEPVQHLLHPSLAVEIDHRVRVPVPREEFLDAERAGAVSGTHEHGIAEPARHQCDAPQDEGSHDDFAEAGVGLDQRQQVLAIHFDDFARFHSASACQ